MSYSGLTIVSSPLVKAGTFIFWRGANVIGILTAERSRFLGQFGLAPEPPAGADKVTMSSADYMLLSKRAAADAPTVNSGDSQK